MHTMVDLNSVQIISKYTIFSCQPFSIFTLEVDVPSMTRWVFQEKKKSDEKSSTKNSNRFYEIVRQKINRLLHNSNVFGDKIVWIACETIRLAEGEK